MGSHRVGHDWSDLVVVVVAFYLVTMIYMFPSSFSLSRGPIYIPQKFITSTESSYAISSVQFSCSVVSDSLWPRELQHARPPCPSPTPGVYSNSCPLSRWCHPTSHPLSSPSPPAFNLSQHQGLFQWVSSSHQVAKVLEFQLQHQFFQWIFRTAILVIKWSQRVQAVKV